MRGNVPYCIYLQTSIIDKIAKSIYSSHIRVAFSENIRYVL